MSQQILSLPDLEAWLSRQPAEKTYDPSDSGACLLFQYLKARGLPVLDTGHLDWTDQSMRDHDIPADVYEAAVFAVPPTFGKALERTRAAMKAA